MKKTMLGSSKTLSQNVCLHRSYRALLVLTNAHSGAVAQRGAADGNLGQITSVCFVAFGKVERIYQIIFSLF